MSSNTETKNKLLALVRDGSPMTLAQQFRLTVALSIPAIMAQISVIIMQYIDASMVGHLGADESASIGLMSTSTWLLGGLPHSVAAGFSVQVAHRIGASDFVGARNVLRQSLLACLAFGSVIGGIGMAVSGALPAWLGGDATINPDATRYFFIYSLMLPFVQLMGLAGGMLRCSGNMVAPSLLGVLMCLLDVLFNFFFIFPTRTVELFGFSFRCPGAGWGVTGAAIATGLAEVIVALLMLYVLCFRSRMMNLLQDSGRFLPERATLRRAWQISFPMALQHVMMCSAQIVSTIIVAPLGKFALAANSFAVTAESLCYMPGYGIADAATTLVGQSMGAGRYSLMRRFALLTVGMGMAVMTLMGVVMYVFSPLMMSALTPVPEIQALGISALRIEAFAEPMFAAAIVSYGVFVGVGDTLIPAGMNLMSMWLVRLTIAAILAPRMGLDGVWTAMCIELCFRGFIFLLRLRFGKWDREKSVK